MNSFKNLTLPQAIVIVGMVAAYFCAHYFLGTNAGHVTAVVDLIIAYLMNSGEK